MNNIGFSRLSLLVLVLFLRYLIGLFNHGKVI